MCLCHMMITLELQTEIIISLVCLFPGKGTTILRGKTLHCSKQSHKEDNVMPTIVPLYANLAKAALLTTGWRDLKDRYLSGCAHKDQTFLVGFVFLTMEIMLPKPLVTFSQECSLLIV